MADPPRLLICGAVEWVDPDPIRTLLMSLAHLHGTLIHGAAKGADSLAGTIAHNLGGYTVEPFPADWRGQGRAAGFIRNKLMLDQRPDVVWAFKDDFDRTLKTGGTENMVKIAKAAGVPTYIVSHG